MSRTKAARSVLCHPSSHRTLALPILSVRMVTLLTVPQD